MTPIGLLLSSLPTPTETSCSQKLTVEHEKYEELSHKYHLMQEEFKKQLQVSEESSRQTVAQLTQLYDGQLEEKAKVLAQVRRSPFVWPGPADCPRWSWVPSTNPLCPCGRSVRTAPSSRSASSRR